MTDQEFNVGDYTQYINNDSSAEVDLAQLQRLVTGQRNAQNEVERLESELAKAKEVLRDYSERQLPGVMDAIGIASFHTSDGLSVEVLERIHANIPANRAPKAFAWLRANDHGSLIKRTLTVAFGKGEDAEANKLYTDLASKYRVKDDEKVHHSTLTAFVKEMLAHGEEIPLDELGVHRQRIAKVS